MGPGYAVRLFRRFAWPEAGADFERPSEYGLEPERLHVTTDDGVPIRGWLFIPESPQGVVIVCHARSASKSRTLKHVELLHRRGFAVVTFDFRGCGESGDSRWRAFSGLAGPLHDLEAIAQYVEGRFGADSQLRHRIALMGCSFGGNMAIAHAGTTGRTYPAMVLDSTPLVHWVDVLDALLRHERRGARGRAVADWLVARAVVAWTRAEALYRRAQRSARNLHRTKVLLIIGARDTLFDIDEACRFLEHNCAGDHEVWLLARGRHLTNHIIDPDAYADRVAGFLVAAFDDYAQQRRSRESDVSRPAA